MGVARGVHSDSRSFVKAAAAQEGGIDESRAGGIQFRDEGILDTRESGLERPGGGREVSGTGKPRHVGVARGIDRDA